MLIGYLVFAAIAGATTSILMLLMGASTGLALGVYCAAGLITVLMTAFVVPDANDEEDVFD
jgi:hypothetical protein